MNILNSVVPLLGQKPIESFYVGANKVYGKNILLNAGNYVYEEFFIKHPVVSESNRVNLDELKSLIGAKIALSFDMELINAKDIGNIGYSFTINHTDGTSQQMSILYNTSMGKAYKGSFISYQDIQVKEISSVTNYKWVTDVSADYLKLSKPKLEYGIKTDFTISPYDI